MIFMFLKMAEKKLERPLNRVSKVLSSILPLCLGIVIFVINAIKLCFFEILLPDPNFFSGKIILVKSYSNYQITGFFDLHI